MLNYFAIFVLVTNLKHIYMKKFYILASALLATMALSVSGSGVVEDN